MLSKPSALNMHRPLPDSISPPRDKEALHTHTTSTDAISGSAHRGSAAAHPTQPTRARGVGAPVATAVGTGTCASRGSSLRVAWDPTSRSYINAIQLLERSAHAPPPSLFNRFAHSVEPA